MIVFKAISPSSICIEFTKNYIKYRFFFTNLVSFSRNTYFINKKYIIKKCGKTKKRKRNSCQIFFK